MDKLKIFCITNKAEANELLASALFGFAINFP